MAKFIIYINDEDFIVFNERKDESPIIGCEIPIDFFERNFPGWWAEVKHHKITKIVEALYEDEMDAAIQEAIRSRNNTKAPNIC